MESDDWPIYDNISSNSSEMMDLDESVGIPIDSANSQWAHYNDLLPLPPWTSSLPVDGDVTGHHSGSPNLEDGMYL